MGRERTIAAVATPAGTGALAIIRISGDEAFEKVSKCLDPAEKFHKAEPKKISLFKFKRKDTGEMIDEVTVIKYRGPSSYTGEDMVEIFCHGGPYIINSIIKELIYNGIDGARKGEFTRRAFINGKMDLTRAEAVKSVIESKTELENKIAVRALSGEYKKKIEKWREKIVEALVQIETEIEFEEDQDIELENKEKRDLLELVRVIGEDLKRREKIKEIEGGLRVVIAGPANAGKSTLFNKIVGYERVLTHHEPGTTRDWVSEKIYIDGNELILIDSAGIRKTENPVEMEGIKKSNEEIEKAGLVIWVSAADERIYEEEKEWIEVLKNRNTIFLLNKVDKKINGEKEKFFKREKINPELVSLKNELNLTDIFNQISNRVRNLNESIEIPDMIGNMRQEKIAEEMMKQIKNAINNWERVEIAAHYLNTALESVEEILGKRDNEEVLNRIFESFCIGK